MRYFPALTGVRGIAALWVFLFHAFQGVKIPFVANGHRGVDLFFVLSGFIISHIHASDFTCGFSWWTFRRFMALRISRIYPLHLLTLFSLLFVVLLCNPFTNVYSPGAFSAFNFVGNLFLVHKWLTPFIPYEMRGPGWSWNGPAWSLSAEWLMYLLFPAIAVILGRSARTSIVLALGVCGLAGYAALEFAGVALAGFPRVGAEFFAGCTIYFGLSNRCELWHYWNLTSWLSVLLILLASIVNGMQVFTPAACCALIPAIAFGNGFIARFFSSKISLQLGEISLALYLIHWPILQIQQRFLPINWNSSWVAITSHFLFLLGIVGLAFLIHRHFELPMRDQFRKWLVGRPSNSEVAKPQDLVVLEN